MDSSIIFLLVVIGISSLTPTVHPHDIPVSWSLTKEELLLKLEEPYKIINQPCDLNKSNLTKQFWTGFFAEVEQKKHPIGKEKDGHSSHNDTEIKRKLNILSDNTTNFTDVFRNPDYCFSGGLLECINDTQFSNNLLCQCMRHPIETVWKERNQSGSYAGCFVEKDEFCVRHFEFGDESNVAPEDRKVQIKFACEPGTKCDEIEGRCLERSSSCPSGVNIVVQKLILVGYVVKLLLSCLILI